MDLDMPQKHDYGAIWEAALNDYKETVGTGIDVLTKAHCVNDVLKEIKARESRFSEHRHDGGKLDRLRSAVSESLVPVERLGHVTATIAGNVYPPAYSIMGAAQFFISNATTMSDDYDRVVKCFEDVKQYLARLEILEESVKLTASIKKAIIDVFTALLALFGIFAKYTKIRRSKKFVKNLLFGEDKDLKDAYTRLQKMVEQEQRVIAYTTQGDVRQIKHDVTALQSSDRRQAAVTERMKYDTSIIAKDVDHLKNQTDTRTILQWLSSLDFLEKHQNVSDKHQEGTGEWLLQNPDFQLFYQSKDVHSVWCSGIPGAGKTVLTSLAINYVEELFQDTGVAIAYFYCDYKDSRTFSEIQFMSSIIKQLVIKHVRVRSDVRVFHDNHTRRSKRPSYDEWLTLLRSVISCFDKTFIYIDALDECAENRRKKFLNIIKTFNTSTRFFITSRDYLELQKSSPQMKRIKIEAHDADVRMFIEARFDENENIHELISKDPTLKEDVVNRICEKSAGMFLLADLLFNYLCEQQNCQAARDCLSSLPSTVDDYYEEAIGRIKDQSESKKYLAEKALSYIYCSKRPLKVDELLEALGVEHKSAGQQQFSPPGANVLRNATAGLISFAPSGLTSLAHYSLQEYFDRIPEALIPDPELDLANTCLTYIMFSDLEVRGPGELHHLLYKLPFLDYASNHFGAHMKANQQNEAILQKLLIFLACKSKFVKVFQICLLHEPNIANGTNPLYDRHYLSPDLSALGFVARLGLQIVFEKIYNSGLYLEDHYELRSPPLHVAAQYGQDDIVRFLAAKNVSLDAQNLEGETALTLAIKHKNTSIVSILITAGADPDLTSFGSDPPLCLGVQSGCAEMTSLLLKHCKLSKNPSFTIGHLFYDAGRLGNRDIMQMLLDVREIFDYARVGWEADYGLEALKGAIDSENKDVVLMIIRHLPALSEKDWNHYNLSVLDDLLYTEFCDKPILQSLLRLAENVNSDMMDWGPHVIYWAWYGDEHMMRLLLEHKADINAVGQYDFSLVHCAVATDDREKVSLLLEKGANPNSKDCNGLTPLHFAVIRGDTKIIQLLLENDANFESEDDEGWTPLHFAFSKKQRRFFQKELNLTNTEVQRIEDDLRYPPVQVHFAAKEKDIFLKLSQLDTTLCDRFSDSEIDPGLLRAQLGYNFSPCVSRIEYRGEKLVWEYLADTKESGLIVDDYASKKGLHGWSLIHLASELDNRTLLKYLLDLGVDINALFFDLTPLHIALFEEKVQNAMLLIQYGADVDIPGRYNVKALHIASSHNNYRLVRLLIGHGADVNAVDYWGTTVLMHAIQEGKSENRLEDELKDRLEVKSEIRSGDRSVETSDESSDDRMGDDSDNDSSGESDDGLTIQSEPHLEPASPPPVPSPEPVSHSELSMSRKASTLVASIHISVLDKYQSATERIFHESKLEIEDDVAESAKTFVSSTDFPHKFEKFKDTLARLLQKLNRKLEDKLGNDLNHELLKTIPEELEQTIVDISEADTSSALACASNKDPETTFEDRSNDGFDNIPENILEERSHNSSDNRKKSELDGTKHKVGPSKKLLLERPAVIRGPSSSELIVGFLLQNGASTNTLSQDGCNALHRAAFFGKSQVMKLLIEAGSNVEVYAEASFRPVDFAIAMGNETAVRLLLEKGASLKADSHCVTIIKENYKDPSRYDRLLPMKERIRDRKFASLPNRICRILLKRLRRMKKLEEKSTKEWTVKDLAELSGNENVKQIVEEHLDNVEAKKSRMEEDKSDVRS